MYKLLLLVISLIDFMMKSFTAEPLQQQSSKSFNQINLKDSTIKEVLADPKDGFKNLFDSETNTATTAKLNPRAISFVDDYMKSHSEKLNKMKSWGRPYFNVIDGILTKHGLPAELKYLSVIESNLKSYAVSWAGAVGPWQFMAATAKLMGLKVNSRVDERTDFYKSTNAAAKYLKNLYNIYGDWLLVIAAYNGGPGNVNAAIRRSGSRNFWSLQQYLPAESRNHVKKFIATHYIMEGEAGITTLTKKETEDLHIANGSTTLEVSGNSEGYPISGKYHSMVITQNLQMDISEFNRLNPNFDKALATTGSYNLRLPEEKLARFQTNKEKILEQSVRYMILSATK